MAAEMGDVRNNENAQRYELEVDGQLAVAAYTLDGEVIAFTHTGVPAALEGKGVGSRLVAGALADARASGLKVRPLCSFVRAYLDRHPEAADLAG